MKQLAEELSKKLEPIVERERERLRRLLAEHGEDIVDQVRVKQVLGGMRGILSMICVTSFLDAVEGVRYRGYPIRELLKYLPRGENMDIPYVEGLLYLLMVGEFPEKEDINMLAEGLRRGRQLSPVVKQVVDTLVEHHPMTIFSAAVLAMQKDSRMARAYKKDVPRTQLWKYTLEDALTIIANLPELVGYIYTRKYGKRPLDIPAESDWGAAFAYAIGNDNVEVQELLRLYMILHADHGGGNVSAHTAKLVGSALSDPFLSFSAGLNGLAGPLHGLANQEVMFFIERLKDRTGKLPPLPEQVVQFVREELQAGRVIPGFGHAVLRQTDPRFLALKEFAEKYCPDDPLIRTVWVLYEVVPPVLQATGKVANPWPNVDLHSGSLLAHYGITEYEFYTVFFGASRALGVMSQLVWDRALLLPIERPKAVTLAFLEHATKME